MSNTINNSQENGAKKKGWRREKVIPPLMLLLVLAITAPLFLFRDMVAELGSYGYLGIFLTSLVANTTILLPMPGILLLLFAFGVTFNPALVGLAAAVGGAIGEMTSYMLGYGGRGVVQNRRLYDRASKWLSKWWGVLTVFVFAATPLPFDVLGLVAGLLRYPVWKFFLALLLGKTLKYIGIALAGARGWEAFVSSLAFVSPPLLTGVLAAIATLVLLMLALVIENWTWQQDR
ncbi:MAG: DedA family protein [Chloroflexi bacterium]|nr:DedA family protein [Chloroflexota bacterium]MBI3041115.1 DedA family protein [Chloroflexota bacterium]MBI3931420.1 DedA family protein [Chloroflexota bacterium]